MINKDNIICIIPARGGSKGIPNKNLISFNGQPLISWSIQQALSTECVQDRVFVTSDSEEILKKRKKIEAKPIKRPASIAGDSASSESALLHALSEIKTHQTVDLIIFLQATSPLRWSKDIDQALSLFEKNNYDSLFSSSEVDCGFICESQENASLKSITYDYRHRKPRQELSDRYIENGSFYITKPQILTTHQNRLGGHIGTYAMHAWQSFEIDRLEDIEICDYFMKRKIIH